MARRPCRLTPLEGELHVDIITLATHGVPDPKRDNVRARPALRRAALPAPSPSPRCSAFPPLSRPAPPLGHHHRAPPARPPCRWLAANLPGAQRRGRPRNRTARCRRPARPAPSPDESPPPCP